MKTKELPSGIIIFSLIEMALGLLTLVAVSFSLLLRFNAKPPNILAFVCITALLSFFLGIGLLGRSRQAYELLLFLAGVVIVSKILIFAGIIQLNGSLETAMPSTLKNIISIVYHGTLWRYLSRKDIKVLFTKK